MMGIFLFKEEINQPHWKLFRTPGLPMSTLTYKHTERCIPFRTSVYQTDSKSALSGSSHYQHIRTLLQYWLRGKNTTYWLGNAIISCNIFSMLGKFLFKNIQDLFLYYFRKHNRLFNTDFPDDRETRSWYSWKLEWWLYTHLNCATSSLHHILLCTSYSISERVILHSSKFYSLFLSKLLLLLWFSWKWVFSKFTQPQLWQQNYLTKSSFWKCLVNTRPTPEKGQVLIWVYTRKEKNINL